MSMGLKLTKAQVSEVVQAVLTRPEASYRAIAANLGISVWTVCQIVARHNIRRQRGSGSTAHRLHKAVHRG